MANWNKHLISPALALASFLPVACRDAKAIELEKGRYKETVAHLSTDKEKSDFFASESEALVKEYLRVMEYPFGVDTGLTPKQSEEQQNAIGSKIEAFSAVAAASELQPSGPPDKDLLKHMYDRLEEIIKNIGDRENGGQYLAQYISNDPTLQKQYYENRGRINGPEHAIKLIHDFEHRLGQAMVNARRYRD